MSSKKSLLISVLVLFCLAGKAQQDFGHKPGLNLVWHDEFDNTAITDSLWQDGFPWGQIICDVGYALRNGGNKSFDNGWLELRSNKEKYTGEVMHWDEQGNYAPYNKEFDYTAAMLYSHKSFTTGYFETKFRSEQSKGLFNSFWLYGDNSSEIDIFELAGSDPGDAQMTLHWKEKDPLTNSTQSISHLQAAPTFADNSHVFGTCWKPEGIDWYYNNKLVQESSWTRYIRSRHIPTVPLNIILNTSIGCLDEHPNNSTPFPARMWFDYVRVYQNTDTVSVPIITNAIEQIYYNYEPQELDMTILSVDDYYQTFPLGFKHEILPGEHYSVSSNKYTIENGYTQPVSLLVRVNDGINWSNTYAVPLTAASNVSIEENTQETFLLHPNPSSGKVSLSNLSGFPLSLKLYSVDGREVFSAELAKKSLPEFDLSHLKAGIYSIIIKTGEGNSIKKLLILH